MSKLALQYLRDTRFTRAFLFLRKAGIAAILCSGLAATMGVCPAAHGQDINLIGVQVAIPTTTLVTPYGVAVDVSGNVYVADTGNNRVLKETLSGTTYTESIVISTGLSSPKSVAVDGIGNIYIADTGNDRVLKETVSGGVYTQSVVDSTLSGPQSIAVDSIGDVYVADTGNNRVLKETLSGGSYIQTTIPSSTLNNPVSIAVAATGDVYIVDQGNSRTLKEAFSAGSYTEHLVTTGALPAAVAVDGSGNVYIFELLDGRVWKETPSGGTYTVDYVPFGGLRSPHSIVVDPSGNIYLADSGLNQILEEKASAGDFGTVNIGTPSSQIPITFSFDIGGSIDQPAVLTQGVTGLDFTDAGSGTCTTNGTSHVYAAYDTCTVNVVFTPTAPGTRYGAIVIRSLSGTTIATAYLRGTGLGPQIAFLPVQEVPLPINVVSASSVAEDAAGNLFIAQAISANSPQNAVVKETRTGGSYTQSTVATGLAYPVGVAVDGAGNVFIADQDATEVKEEVPLPGGGYTPGTIFSGMGNVESVAVDGNGNVYIGSLASGLVKETLLRGISRGYSQSIIDNNVHPSGIAVDASGNIYFTQNDNQLFKKTLSAGSYTQSIIDSRLRRALEVALDGMGNVYVADTGNNQIVKETLSGTVYTPAPLGGGLNGVSGVTVNGAGNVISSSAQANHVYAIIQSDPQGLSFATTNIGATSTAQTKTVENIGNAPLSFPVPTWDTNLPTRSTNPSIDPNFSLDSTGASSCPVVAASSSTAGTLAAGASCQLSISFAPIKVDYSNTSLRLGVLLLRDTSLNASAPDYAAQTLTLSGTVPPALSFAAIRPQIYGNPPFNVSATSASNGAVTYTVLSGPAAITGSTVTLTGVGIVVLNANQEASGYYVAATTMTSFTVAAPNFTLASGTSSGSATTTAGGKATYSLVIAPPAGAVFPDAITFAATGLPAGATTTFTPVTVPAGSGTTTVTLTIQTTANESAEVETPFPGGPLAPMALGFLFLPLATLKQVRRRLPHLSALVAITALLLSSALGLSGCSSNGSKSTPAAKTYTVVVTATDMTANIKSSTNLTLIVQ